MVYSAQNVYIYEPNIKMNWLMTYNWQQKDWPDFTYDHGGIEEKLFEFTERAGKMSGLLEGVEVEDRIETIIDLMVSEAMKTSEIEGEHLNKKEVASSIRRQMGLDYDIDNINDQRAEGVSELMIEVRNQFQDPLSEEMLFAWHTMLMKGHQNVKAGAWRIHEEPMQIVSGALGKEKVHFEAPPSKVVPVEMNEYISWFNKSLELRPPVRSAIAHLYFETIHPFEDGNGRIGRAISEKTLSQGIGRPVVLSLSHVIEEDRNVYYEALKEAQRSNDITNWMEYFINTIIEAQQYAESLVVFTIKKSQYFNFFRDQLNERQLKVIQRMFEEGPKGFEGGMRARKYKSIAGVSKATATRDLQDLVAKNALTPKGGGRSTRYDLNIDLVDV